MRIAHLCLAGAFTEGMNYQDNVLVDINRQDGHEVLVVSDCMVFRDGRLSPAEPEDRMLSNGARLVRIPFDRVGPRWLTNKLKRSRKLPLLLEEFEPDVILYHGVIGWSLRVLTAYKRRHPDVRIYLDSHEDRHNSATNWVSYFFQYRLLTRWLAHRVLPSVEKVLYISLETRDFLRDLLNLPDDVLEYYPLGGLVVPDERRRELRRSERARLGLAEDAIIFLHSGKLDQRKRTMDIVRAFRSLEDQTARLLIVGRIEDDVAADLVPAIAADDRILFLGWLGTEALTGLMCAADVYVQPGGQSASLQHAICCGLPVLARSYPSHEPFVRDNGFFVENEVDIAGRMAEFVEDPQRLKLMRAASYAIAYDLLDYRKLAARLYR